MEGTDSNKRSSVGENSWPWEGNLALEPALPLLLTDILSRSFEKVLQTFPFYSFRATSYFWGGAWGSFLVVLRAGLKPGPSACKSCFPALWAVSLAHVFQQLQQSQHKGRTSFGFSWGCSLSPLQEVHPEREKKKQTWKVWFRLFQWDLSWEMRKEGEERENILPAPCTACLHRHSSHSTTPLPVAEVQKDKTPKDYALASSDLDDWVTRMVLLWHMDSFGLNSI